MKICSTALLFVLILGGWHQSQGQQTPATDDTAQTDVTQEAPALPPARTHYMGRRIAPTMSHRGAGWLIRKERDAEERPREALRALQLEPGMTVCDLGCGNGFWTLLLSRGVGPEGTVLAVDIQPEMLTKLRLRCQEAEVTNVKPILGGIANPNLPHGKVDLLLMVDVYHEFSHPELMLRNIRESLSEDGVIALLEYREEDPRVPILPLHKMSRKQIVKEYKANGLKVVRQYNKLPWQHLMFFGRDPDWNPDAEEAPSPAAEEASRKK